MPRSPQLVGRHHVEPPTCPRASHPHPCTPRDPRITSGCAPIAPRFARRYLGIRATASGSVPPQDSSAATVDPSAGPSLNWAATVNRVCYNAAQFAAVYNTACYSTNRAPGKHFRAPESSAHFRLLPFCPFSSVFARFTPVFVPFLLKFDGEPQLNLIYHRIS